MVYVLIIFYIVPLIISLDLFLLKHIRQIKAENLGKINISEVITIGLCLSFPGVNVGIAAASLLWMYGSSEEERESIKQYSYIARLFI